MSRRRVSRRRSRSSRRELRSKKTYMTVAKCKEALQEKIRIIKREGKYSGKQAVAIAYSMIGKKYPNCKKVFSRSRR